MRSRFAALVAVVGIVLRIGTGERGHAALRRAAAPPRPSGRPRSHRSCRTARDASAPWSRRATAHDHVVLQPSNTAELDERCSTRSTTRLRREYEQWLTPGEFAALFGPSPDRGRRDHRLAARRRGCAHDASTASPCARRGDVAARRAGARRLVLELPARRRHDGLRRVGGAARSRRARAGDHARSSGSPTRSSSTTHLDLHPSGRVISPPPATAFARPDAAEPRAPRRAPRPATSRATTSGPPTRSADFYRVQRPVRAGHGRAGQDDRVARARPSRPSDTKHYLSCFGLHNQVTVARSTAARSADQLGTLEAEIDIQEAATQAPGASIRLVRSAEHRARRVRRVQRDRHRQRRQVISTSWGKCESLRRATAPGVHRLAAHAVPAGGRAGSDGVRGHRRHGLRRLLRPTDGVRADTTLQVDNPADDPFVTGVGGTSLGAPGLEPVWNDCEDAVGDSCAGRAAATRPAAAQSTIFNRPTWQPLAPTRRARRAARSPTSPPTPASARSFWDSDFGPATDAWTPVGGTSIAAPKLAGIRRRHRLRLHRWPHRRLRPQARRARQDPRVRHRAHRRQDRHQLPGTNPVLDTPGNNDLTRNNADTYHDDERLRPVDRSGHARSRAGLSCPQIASDDPDHGARRERTWCCTASASSAATIRFGSTKAHVLSATATTATVVVPDGQGRGQRRRAPTRSAAARTTRLFDYPGADTSAYRTVTADGGRLRLRRRRPLLRLACRGGHRADHRHGGRPRDRRLLARLRRRQRLQLQRAVPRLDARHAPQPADRRHRGDRERRRLLARRARRRHLRVRQRALPRLDRRHPPQPADRRHRGRHQDRRLLARRLRRRHLRVPRDRSTARPARSTSTSRSSASPATPRPAATGSSRPTAASSRSTRRSTARPARST